jgi:hypothetical protein
MSDIPEIGDRMKSSVNIEGCVKNVETFLVNWIPLATFVVSGNEAKAEAAM